jgi:hypothetical protein
MTEKKKKRGRPPKAKTSTDRGFVERALEGMVKRMEEGSALTDKEVPLLCALLQAQNAKALLTENDFYENWERRLGALEAWLNTQRTLQSAMSGSRRAPPRAGPPNFNAGITPPGNSYAPQSP